MNNIMEDRLMTKGEFTRLEIASQPEVWQATYEKILGQKDELTAQLGRLKGRPFVVIGCGSTYYLSVHVAAVLRSQGVQAWAFPSSELVFFPQVHLPADFVLLVISRSGTTTESLWAIDAYRKTAPNATVISITCTPQTPMIARSDFALLSEAAGEKSVAQTRSFTSMTLMAQMLAAMLSGDEARLAGLKQTPDVLRPLFEQHRPMMEPIGRDVSIERFFFLGSGPYYGLANEAMLKTKEMSCSWAEAYNILEFRHGPMALVNEHTLVVGLVSDQAGPAEVKVLQEMKARGARLLAFCERRGDLDWSGVDEVVEVHSGLDDWSRGFIYLPLIQWIAYHRSLARGMDPDSPGGLEQVIVLD
jgi:glucosamine--fructose-6-phosphate aminotransferase (isomerizing)